MWSVSGPCAPFENKATISVLPRRLSLADVLPTNVLVRIILLLSFNNWTPLPLTFPSSHISPSPSILSYSRPRSSSTKNVSQRRRSTRRKSKPVRLDGKVPRASWTFEEESPCLGYLEHVLIQEPFQGRAVVYECRVRAYDGTVGQEFYCWSGMFQLGRSENKQRKDIVNAGIARQQAKTEALFRERGLQRTELGAEKFKGNL